MALAVRIRMATVTTKQDANGKVNKTSKGYVQGFLLKPNWLFVFCSKQLIHSRKKSSHGFRISSLTKSAHMPVFIK